MTRRWIRLRPGARETAAAAMVAGVLASAVGTVTFYLARLILSREPMGRDLPGEEEREELGRGGGA